MPSLILNKNAEAVKLAADERSPVLPPKGLSTDSNGVNVHDETQDRSSHESGARSDKKLNVPDARGGLGKVSPKSSLSVDREHTSADESPRTQKGANGIVTGGPYILSAPMHRPGQYDTSNPALSRPTQPERSTGDLSARGNGSKPNRLEDAAEDRAEAPTLAPNGAAGRPAPVTAFSDREIRPPTGDRVASPSSPTNRQRRVHSASNSDTLQTAPLTPSHSLIDPSRAPPNRLSSPPYYDSPSLIPTTPPSPQNPSTYRLQHRHTLQIPKATTQRGSRDLSWVNSDASEDAISSAVSPAGGLRRSSLNLVRRTTRSGHSETYLDDIPQDADAARWAEKIQAKRMSRRRRKEEEEDDRVMVGTKVDQNHVNWVTAYNMLTGIRFTVSRTNAKLDRELTDADFGARHKFSFDITGNELTPSAKYDFKFKDYAPWVFRHLRAIFHLDPADYLISLTSKYILSELGSPGKSGSFFYFSRDYKYIIKTIHQAEHKMLRKVLREYYDHVRENPNTLISQFYGLHRVKMPFGRKIHFVVMNNLFPPHRDVHQTFDLKGSTIGRNLREEELAKNPRATLKDLNWLRRDHHLELGPSKKQMFVEQMKRDVALLQKLHIMDYSLLVGIHDVSKGNEENLRDKTLQVFEPGGEETEGAQRDGPSTLGALIRTASKQEKQRKARELRQAIKRERPVPMDMSSFQMPNNNRDAKKNFCFYSDDGGFRATHENGSPGEEIYYLGIIDCLTHYGFVKRIENFLKGMSGNEAQISPVPPQFYGERFIKFISGITITREEADRQRSVAVELQSQALIPGPTQLDSSQAPIVKHHASPDEPSNSQDNILARAEKEAARTQRHGGSEEEKFDRTLKTTRSPSVDRGQNATGTTLPVLEEIGESGSVGGRSGWSGPSAHSSRGELRAGSEPGSRLRGSGSNAGNPNDQQRRGLSALAPQSASPQTLSPPLGGRPPPTPPRDTPTKDTLFKDTNSKGTPLKEWPLKDTPSKDTTTKNVPVLDEPPVLPVPMFSPIALEADRSELRFSWQNQDAR